MSDKQKTSETHPQYECNGLVICPDCGGSLKYYHSSFTYGDGITRVVCSRKCHGGFVRLI